MLPVVCRSRDDDWLWEVGRVRRFAIPNVVVRRCYFAGGHEVWTPAIPAWMPDLFENKVGAIMVDRADSREIAKRAKELYEARWRAELERDHLPEFVAMEPESATSFRGTSFHDATRSARHAPSDRVTFTLRIGHDCAIEMVGMQIERQLFPR